MSARRDRIMARILASGLLFVALLAFTLFAFTQQRAKRIAAQPGWALTAIEDVDIPPATAAPARGILARRPLHQDRKSVVSGKSVSVPVDLGVRRRITNKNNTTERHRHPNDH